MNPKYFYQPYYMSIRTKYSETFPLNRLDVYTSNDLPEFQISYEKKQIVPGSTLLVADKIQHLVGGNPIDVGDQIYMDEFAGDHAFFRNIQTETTLKGSVENLNNYPRLVAMQNEATMLLQNLGAMTDRSMEMTVGDRDQLRGYMNGDTDGIRWGFCIRPRIWINKSDKPLDYRKFGDINIQLNMSPDEHVYYGSDATTANDPTYQFTNLRLVYRYYDLDDPRAVDPNEPVTFERYHNATDAIESNDAVVSTRVPGLTSTVHMTFNSQYNLSTRTENYLERAVIPGKPTLNTVFEDPSTVYGAERVSFGINETDTALYGYDQQFREEMLWNYLRSFVQSPVDYSVAIGRLNRGQGYGLGTPFGSIMDFRNKKFSCRIESEASQAADTTKFQCFMYFPIIDVY